MKSKYHAVHGRSIRQSSLEHAHCAIIEWVYSFKQVPDPRIYRRQHCNIPRRIYRFSNKSDIHWTSIFVSSTFVNLYVQPVFAALLWVLSFGLLNDLLLYQGARILNHYKRT